VGIAHTLSDPYIGRGFESEHRLFSNFTGVELTTDTIQFVACCSPLARPIVIPSEEGDSSSNVQWWRYGVNTAEQKSFAYILVVAFQYAIYILILSFNCLNWCNFSARECKCVSVIMRAERRRYMMSMIIPDIPVGLHGAFCDSPWRHACESDWKKWVMLPSRKLVVVFACQTCKLVNTAYDVIHRLVVN